jgi:hypothetical protein
MIATIELQRWLCVEDNWMAFRWCVCRIWSYQKNKENMLLNCVYMHVCVYDYTSSHDKTGFYLKRGSDILESKIYRHALESGLFPLSQHPINTYRVRAVPLVLDPQLLPR